MDLQPEYIITVALAIANEVRLETPDGARVLGRRKAQQRLFESAVAGDVILTDHVEEDGRRYAIIRVFNYGQYMLAQQRAWDGV